MRGPTRTIFMTWPVSSLASLSMQSSADSPFSKCPPTQSHNPGYVSSSSLRFKMRSFPLFSTTPVVTIRVFIVLSTKLRGDLFLGQLRPAVLAPVSQWRPAGKKEDRRRGVPLADGDARGGGATQYPAQDARRDRVALGDDPIGAHDVHAGAGGYQGKALYLLLRHLQALHLDDVLASHLGAADVRHQRDREAVLLGVAQEPKDRERLARRDVVDDAAVGNLPHQHRGLVVGRLCGLAGHDGRSHQALPPPRTLRRRAIL